ncbi:MAG TPA: hypothetical protein VFQ26_00945, partial [Nitrospiraceae bacterium]|nr:hypothetical protein [Nitrospiraceae bacterium]
LKLYFVRNCFHRLFADGQAPQLGETNSKMFGTGSLQQLRDLNTRLNEAASDRNGAGWTALVLQTDRHHASVPRLSPLSDRLFFA